MTDDPILARVRDALRAMYGDNIDRIVLFGSRARGDARADSDYDVAIFFKDLPSRSREFIRLGDLRYEMMVETGQFFDLLPFASSEYDHRTPIMWDIRGQGLDL